MLETNFGNKMAIVSTGQIYAESICTLTEYMNSLIHTIYAAGTRMRYPELPITTKLASSQRCKEEND